MIKGTVNEPEKQELDQAARAMTGRSRRLTAIVLSFVSEITHKLPVSFYASPDGLRLCDLARRTKRYSICDIGPGLFEISDDRYLLDHLLRYSDLWPATNDPLESDFEKMLEQLSRGPWLSPTDRMMLASLAVRIEGQDPREGNTAYTAALDAACVLRGTCDQVEYFLQAALDHRVQ
jgi:hypothetical protein